jgi:hypothetical protein
MFLGSNLAILALSLAIFAITVFVAMLLLIALAFALAVNAHNGGDKTAPRSFRVHNTGNEAGPQPSSKYNHHFLSE